MKQELSATMAGALGDILERGGRVVRHQGGYWTEPGASHTAIIGAPFAWWISTPTIEALVRRGRLAYTEWKEGRGGKFPIAAEVSDVEGRNG